MLSARLSTSLSVLGFAFAIAGCSGQAGTSGVIGSTTEPSTQVADPSTATADAAAHDHHGPPGREMLLFAALHEDIGLTAAQKQSIQAAIDASRPSAPPVMDRTPFVTLAAGVRAGKVDVAAVVASQKTNDDGGESAHQAAAAKALATLHATLTPDQRRALVAAVNKRMADHAGPHPDGAKAPGDHPHDGPMAWLVEGLNLTTAQTDAIHAKLEANRPSDADHTAMKAHFETEHAAMQARLATFANDDFDAVAFTAPPADAPKMGPKNHLEWLANHVAIVTSVLDAGQREQLAVRLEQGPPAHGGRPHDGAGTR